MTYEEILGVLAPCGLNCRKCFGHIQGDVGRLSAELRHGLGNFDVYAERFSAFLPAFRSYPAFRDLLAYLAEPDCKGCREGTCKYPDCGVVDCFRERGVDFCFQCGEFPCEKTNFDPHLQRRWIDMNLRMREVGVEAFFEETRDLPRYR